MHKRKLGATDLDIMVIGVGAWAAGGGGHAWGWGPQDDTESIAAIHAALDHGVNWIDTAPIYGFGHSEQVVGRALASHRGAKPYVFTKCGFRWDDDHHDSWSLKQASIREEVENSLRRLGLDTIDLYQIHWPGYPPYGDTADIEEACWMLVELGAEGKLRNIGVSNFDTAQLDRIQRIARVESLQSPYSAVNRDLREGDPAVLPRAPHGCARVLADGAGSAQRQHDARTRRAAAEG